MQIKIPLLLAAMLILTTRCGDPGRKQVENCKTPEGLHKLEYHHPEIIVDLDVGFKSVPMPMDFDGDGDMDLLISESASYAGSGVFYFENISGNVEMPLFRYGMQLNSERFRLGLDGACFVVSEVGEHIHVFTPDRVNDKLLMYADVPQNVFWEQMVMPVPAAGHVPRTKSSTWQMLDFDNDGIFDLISAASAAGGDFLLFFKNIGTNEMPLYIEPEKIRIMDGSFIKRGYHLEATLADYDNDGDYDFIAIGPYSRILYFENTGSPESYAFRQGTVLKHDGEEIQFECRFGSSIKPRAVDFDGDGHVDIIAGDEDGKVSFLKNTGRVIDGIPQFMPPRFFQQKAKYVDFGALVAPRVFDWDGDGREDIVCGNGAGYIGFIRNLGGRPLKFDKPELLKADGEVIRILPPGAHWGYVTIDVGYWNEDDLPDILLNNHHGNVLWYENTGTRQEPELTGPKPLEVRWEGEPQAPEFGYAEAEENELIAPWRTSPLIMDFNEDGLNDLVMLDYQDYLAVYERFREGDRLLLKHPRRSFVYPDGEPILLNQLKGSSSGRLKISFADWDGDGLADLIVSSKPAVDWMKNMGREDGKMVLQYMGRIISKTLMGHTDGPVTSDFNRDGIPDLLVGTETGVFQYWERSNVEVTTTMTTTGRQTPASYKYFKR